MRIKKIVKDLVYSDPVFKVYEQLSYSIYKKRIKELQTNDDLRLHLASGNKFIDGWINIDKWLNPRVLGMSLPQGLKRFKDNSVQYIYSSHFMEHLEYPGKVSFFANECNRILVPGGAMRIIVPDIEKIIEAYVSNDEPFFKIQSTMHPLWCKTKLDHLMYALQQEGEHKYGYDFETMSRLLVNAEFKEVVQSDFNKSSFPPLNVDYRKEIDNKGRYLSLYVDAIKAS